MHQEAQVTIAQGLSLSVARAMLWTRQNVVEQIAPVDVARHVHVCHSHLCRLFKKEIGTTISAYIIDVRLERATMLLANPTLRITEVAFSSGFGSIQRFNAAFKVRFGLSPTAYRRSQFNDAGEGI